MKLVHALGAAYLVLLTACGCGSSKAHTMPAPGPAPVTGGPDEAKPAVADVKALDYSAETLEPGENGAPAAAGPAAPDKEGIRVTIRQHLGDLAGCYKTALATDDKLTGSLEVKFTIGGSDGKVTDVTATGAGDDTLHACTTAVFQGMAFTAPADHQNIVVSYPLNLQFQAP